MNIFKEAEEIILKRSEEQERQYGDIDESMKKAAEIASIMTGNHVSVKDMYLYMVALKLSRESHKHKHDNLLDAIAYLGALDNYLNKKDGDEKL